MSFPFFFNKELARVFIVLEITNDMNTRCGYGITYNYVPIRSVCQIGILLPISAGVGFEEDM